VVLAQALQELVRRATQEIARFDYDPRLKIGIDSGRCIAINDGKGCEQEPLFLGSAANYAAKLADGDGQGIFLSNRVRSLMGLATLFRGLSEERSTPLGGAQLLEFRNRAHAAGFDLPPNLTGDQNQLGRLIAEWQRDIREHRATTGGVESFQFHGHTPPLRSIDYGLLTPANSIRMPVASIFADLDGYTAYIDSCMNGNRAGEAVRALHVLRGEFHHVLRDDFKSRKVRYVGDCIHGVLAFGTSSVDMAQTVRESIKCAAGLQGSFEIVQQRLGGLEELGLATGIEVGQTPISRIGIRGDRSVRVASSTATIQSQCEQERIEGSGIAVGPEAYSHMSLSARRYFPDRRYDRPDYDTVVDLLGIGASIAAAAAAPSSGAASEPEFRPHTLK
jgi:class 3 adenylate cyclase